MNKKVLLSWLILVALIATSAFAPVTAASLSASTSSSAEPQRGVLADSDDSDDRDDSDDPDGPDDDDRDNDDRDDDDDPDKPPTPTPTNIPEGPLPPVAKPDISNPADLSDQPLSTVLGFTFPSGVHGGSTIPLEATAFLDIQPPDSDGFTQVGIVAVNFNPSPSSPGIEGPFIARNDNDDDGDDNDTGEDDNGNGDDDEDNGNDDDTGDDDDDDGGPTPTPTPTPDPGEIVSETFIVEIDLVSTTDIVPGRLFSFTTEEIIDVNFSRIPQIVNPLREEAIYPEFQLDSALTNAATITSDGVCFVVNTAETGFVRYCTTPETSSPLSVKDSFPTQYTELRNMMIAAAARIGHEAPLALGQTLSTIEDGQSLQDCDNATDCTSDIIVTPVTRDYFDHKYNQKFGGGDGDNGGDGEDRDHENGDNGDNESQTVSRATASIERDDDRDNRDNGDRDDEDGKPNQSPTPIDIAIVRILQPIEFPTDDSLVTVLVQPGDYRVDAWFDANGVFFAATLTGLTADDIPVINQQIPAIPPIFIRVSGPGQPLAQISGLDLRVCCLGRECRR